MTEQKEGTCCPNCFHKKRFSGYKGIVDICTNDECLCHHPLGINVGDKSGVRDKMGKF